jgi:hypothetical protein
MQKVSEHYGIDSEKLKEGDIFDSIIGTDNPYFFDPSFLPFTKVKEFENAREELLEHFKKVIALIKTGNPAYFEKAVEMLRQPDLKGASTGYGASDDGAGVGPKLARILATNAKELIESGNDDPILFEIIGMFTPEFGPDRLGDLVNGILRKNIYHFTERVADEFGIKREFKIVYQKEEFLLPTHPLSSKKPILFFPESVLSPLPIALSWEDVYASAVFNSETRDNFNEFLKPLFKNSPKPDKAELKKYLFSEDTKERASALLAVYKSVEPNKYDFEKDPAGFYRWYEDAKEIFAAVLVPEIKSAATLEELIEAVDTVITYFKRGIENHMWKHSYEQDGTPKHESYFQSLFLLIAEPLCAEKNIDVAPESDKGRGPVDFKLSRGKENVTVEMKLTSNTSLAKGFKVQLPIYAKAEQSGYSFFVVVKTTDVSKQLEEIETLVEDDKSGKISLRVINALPKESASKAKKVDE